MESALNRFMLQFRVLFTPNYVKFEDYNSERNGTKAHLSPVKITKN